MALEVQEAEPGHVAERGHLERAGQPPVPEPCLEVVETGGEVDPGAVVPVLAVRRQAFVHHRSRLPSSLKKNLAPRYGAPAGNSNRREGP